MTDFFSNDLGIVCVAFWIMLGFLLMWAYYKVSPLLGDDHGNPQEQNDEEINKRNALLEHFRESESFDHQNENEPHKPEQPTNSENQ